MSDFPPARSLRRPLRVLRTRLQRSLRQVRGHFHGLPDFLVLGTMKGGTSELYRLLARHPQVLEAARKEVHFFDGALPRPLGYYRAFFPTRRALSAAQARQGRRVITGEATPYYLFHPRAPQAIRHAVPGARLIVLLRDPVTRAYSHWRMERRLGFEELPFAEALQQEPERLRGEEQRLVRDPSYKSYRHQHFSYLARGHYLEQLARYEALFPRDQLLVIQSERLRERTQEVYDKITDFLALERYTLPLQPPPPRRTSAVPEREAESLRAYYADLNPPLERHLETVHGWGDTGWIRP